MTKTYLSSEHEQMHNTSERLEEESAIRFNELIGVFILIGESVRTKKEKKAMIRREVLKMNKWIDKFSDNSTKIYNRYVKKAYRQMGKRAKQLSGAQAKERTLLKDELVGNMKGKLSDYEKKAQRLVLMKELEKLREADLGYKNATAKSVVNKKKLRKNFVFMTSKGKRMKTNHIMKLVVGDAIWQTMMSAKVSTWTDAGEKWGIWRSIIDSRTTPYCRAMNGKKIDIRTHAIPPVHYACRSTVEIINK